LKRKLLSTNLSKDLRKKHNKRNIPLRKGDIVKVMRGKFRGKQGKVMEVKTKMEKIFVEKIQIKKRDGSSVNVPLKASNLQIIELNTKDRKRKLKISTTLSDKQTKKPIIKVAEKKIKKENSNKKLKEKKK
jgi:large subunit ribosomal protein L24